MATGTVTSYHQDHGYGSITPDDGGPEVIVYFDSVVAQGSRASAADPHSRVLTVGQKVSYQAAQEEGRTVAEHVRLL